MYTHSDWAVGNWHIFIFFTILCKNLGTYKYQLTTVFFHPCYQSYPQINYKKKKKNSKNNQKLIFK